MPSSSNSVKSGCPVCSGVLMGRAAYPGVALWADPDVRDAPRPWDKPRATLALAHGERDTEQ